MFDCNKCGQFFDGLPFGGRCEDCFADDMQKIYPGPNELWRERVGERINQMEAEKDELVFEKAPAGSAK